ncbi:MAG: tetratricopeptide repeat protein [Pirellulales bacterium]|nr:tetratricopeptide repeat protein [Pirellulales bacterium]
MDQQSVRSVRRASTPKRKAGSGTFLEWRSALGLLVAASFCGVLAGCAGGPEISSQGLQTEPGGAVFRSNAAESGRERTPAPKAKKASGKKLEKKTAKALLRYNQDLTTGREAEQHGDLAKAREVYERLLCQQPERYEAYHRLAVVADRQRRFEEAQSLYTQAIRRNGRNPELFNDLGYCFYLQGELEKAESALLKAVAMQPAEPRYRNNLGLVYGGQQRYEEALAQYRRAGGEGNAFYNLAFVKASQNDFAGAKDCFRRALAADPTHERAHKALASFENAENQSKDSWSPDPLCDGEVSWVPYVENDAHKAVVNPSISSNKPVRPAHTATIQRSATKDLVNQAQARTALSESAMPR